MDPSNQLAAAILEGRATDLETISKDLRAGGIPYGHTEFQARQLRHNAKELREGKPQTSLHQ